MLPPRAEKGIEMPRISSQNSLPLLWKISLKKQGLKQLKNAHKPFIFITFAGYR